MELACSECGAAIVLDVERRSFGVPVTDWLKCSRYVKGEPFRCSNALREGSAELQRLISGSSG